MIEELGWSTKCQRDFVQQPGLQTFRNPPNAKQDVLDLDRIDNHQTKHLHIGSSCCGSLAAHSPSRDSLVQRRSIDIIGLDGVALRQQALRVNKMSGNKMVNRLTDAIPEPMAPRPIQPTWTDI